MSGLTVNPKLAYALLAVLALVALLPGQAQANGAGTLEVTADTTLTQDFAGKVVIAEDGVTLDCAGHRITGDGQGRGVLVDNRNGVTVKNCDVSNFATGFFVASTSGSTFDGNRSHDNQLPGGKKNAGWINGAGFWLQSSSGNTFSNNSIYDNPGDGFDAFSASTNLFVNNTITGNLAGFFFGNHAVGNTLQGNSAALNEVFGFVLATGASNNTLLGNTADGNGWGFLIGSDENALEANTATGNVDGFGLVDDATSNILTNNIADSNTFDGFFVADRATSNTLEGNAATSNENGFAIVNGATDNELARNVSSSNTLRGFAVAFGANDNTLDGNSAAGNGTGCGTCGGFIVFSASMNELIQNDSNDNLGYGFALFSATSNSVSENAGCDNSIFDAFQDAASTGNIWTNNVFCTSEGI